MKRIAALLAVFVVGQAGAAEILSPQAFTAEFAKALGAAAPSATVTVGQELQLTLQRGDDTSTVNLFNAYREYAGDPARFNELVAIFANAVKNPTPGKLDRARIVPMIKDRAWLAEIEPIFRVRDAEVLHDPFNNELVVVYVEDSETRARYLSTLDNVGDRKALRALAIENLLRVLPKIERHQYGDTISRLTAGGDYDVSLLLLDDIWASGQIKVDGDIVVAIPARDMLLVTGSQDRKGLKVIREIAGKMAQGPYPLTSTLFVYRKGKLVKFGRI